MAEPINVGSSSQWQTILSSNNLVIADFYADWCGPCKMIAPIFADLAREHTRPRKVAFAKVNADSQKGVASLYGVSAMPTFIIFHRGNAIKTIQGANPQDLRSQVAASLKLADQGGPGGSAGFSGSGRRLGGTGVGRGGVASAGTGLPAVSLDPIRIIRALLTFIGLYFWTLFSLDPYKAAENSPFNPNRPAPSYTPARGSGPVNAPPKPAPSFRTFADLKSE